MNSLICLVLDGEHLRCYQEALALHEKGFCYACSNIGTSKLVWFRNHSIVRSGCKQCRANWKKRFTGLREDLMIEFK